MQTGYPATPRIPHRGIGADFLCCKKTKSRYNVGMHMASFAIRVLEILFFSGLLGASVVVVISFVEDARELRGDE
jgi:hypothetical protein